MLSSSVLLSREMLGTSLWVMMLAMAMDLNTIR